MTFLVTLPFIQVIDVSVEVLAGAALCVGCEFPLWLVVVDDDDADDDEVVEVALL